MIINNNLKKKMKHKSKLKKIKLFLAKKKQKFKINPIVMIKKCKLTFRNKKKQKIIEKKIIKTNKPTIQISLLKILF